MPDILNSNITISTQIASAPVSAQSFGQVLYLARPGSSTLPDAVTRYSLASEVAAALDAGDITQETADALEAAFAQSPRTPIIAVGTIASTGAQSSSVTLGGTTALAGEIFRISIDGRPYTFTAVGAETPAQIAVALAALVDADPYVGATDDTNDVLIDGVGGTMPVPFDVDVYTDSAGVTMAAAVITAAATDIGAAMDALLAEDDDWYGLASEMKGRGMSKALAAWAETNKRLFLAQTSSALDLSGDALSLSQVVKTSAREYTSVIYHGDDSEELAYAIGVIGLSTDLDTTTRTWAYIRPSGMTDPALSTTQRTTLDAAYCSYLGGFYGALAFFEGKTGAGRFTDQRTSLDWLDARIPERLAQLLLDSTARGEKVPYTDAGISQMKARVRSVLEDGLAAGHFVEILDDATGLRLSPAVTAPALSSVLPADRAARLLRLEYKATLAGAIHKVSVQGYISVTL